LLAFATWTLITLAATVGVYRWSRILSRRSKITDFAEYRIEGAEWYKRALRAHANCVENLPVFGAIVIVTVAVGIDRDSLDVLAIIFMAARVLQTSVHVLFEQNTVATSFRSAFFNIQWTCMLLMALVVGSAAA
jgi:uncharacterized MAPEG superfamily protein